MAAGAIQTIMQLLKKQETCAAAITMLGKTVELCAAEVCTRPRFPLESFYRPL